MESLKSLSDTSGMGRCKALWVIWENETSSQEAGSAVCSLYLDTAGHGCRGEGLRRGVKCDTKAYRVVNMSLLCTYLFNVRGFNGNKTVTSSVVSM